MTPIDPPNSGPNARLIITLLHVKSNLSIRNMAKNLKPCEHFVIKVSTQLVRLGEIYYFR